MDHSYAIVLAKITMKKLMDYGHFSEFADHREPDELNEGCAEIIAAALMGDYDKEADGPHPDEEDPDTERLRRQQEAEDGHPV